MTALEIDAKTLYELLGLPESPILVDIRNDTELEDLPRMIPGSIRDKTDVDSCVRSLPRTRSVVLYDSAGDRARSEAMRLAQAGFRIGYLKGGFDAWRNSQYATIRARPQWNVPGDSRWITRERPKIDRLACPWLVKRFIDPNALFFYTAAHRVRTDAETLNAQPFDIADVTFSHRGVGCSFDAFLDEFDLHDPCVDKLAVIIRAADTGRLDQSREAPGLLAISLGLSASIDDDLLLLDQALPIYDALYAWCKKAGGETHAWPGRVIK